MWIPASAGMTKSRNDEIKVRKDVSLILTTPPRSLAVSGQPIHSMSDVVVLGGGIAGIAAALQLLDNGCQVTLVEARNFLGGRAFSFTDTGTGLTLDNGQHVFVGCCTHFIDFLERLGAREGWAFQERLNIPVRSRSGVVGKLAAAGLPAPLHLLPSFLAYPHLALSDKLRALAGMVRARLTDRTMPYLEDITFYRWLKENGQSERAIQNLWNLVVEPTLNDNVRDVSAAMGLMIVQDGMLGGATGGNLGYAKAGLLPALGEPAQALLEEKGANLLLGAPVRQVLFEADGAGGTSQAHAAGVELVNGQRVSGRQFISALPFSVLLRILPSEIACQDFFHRIGGLEWSPIVNLHILYDRQIMEEPLFAFVDSPLQWVFNRNAISRCEQGDGRQLVTVSVSAAWQYKDMPREELATKFTKEMAEVFAEAREADVLNVTVVKQREATFRCVPGAGRLRPGPVTTIPNLLLAGEWTNTGWPSTMEGAVRSGNAAAQALIQSRRQAPDVQLA